MKTGQTGEKIAIVGLGTLFPGANTPEQFWNNLVANASSTSQATEAEFGVDPARFFSAAKGKLDTCYSTQGGFIRDFQFNPNGYKLSAQTLLQQDRLGHWCLYVAREALQNSGYWQHEGLNRCGVIMGNLSFPTQASWQVLSGIYTDMARQTLQTLTDTTVEAPGLSSTQSAGFQETILATTPSALIAQAVGLAGPHYSLDAACASSLYAIKLACDELLNGNADMMLAGAVSGAHPLQIHIGFSYFHAYPLMSERSAPLDQQSNGLTSAEGAGIVLLKRLTDAERDGDTIHAVIEGIGLSNDGKGEFLLTPNPKGQRLAFERAYTHTAVQPHQLDYLECHATGTRLGDKVELNSISDFFGEQLPYIGSVKSNVGHLLTASGMASLVKVIYGIKHRLLPATIGIATPLSAAMGRLGAAHMIRENKPWNGEADTLRAGINAFGFGGTNAHLLVSSPEPRPDSPRPTMDRPASVQLAIVGMDLHMGDCENLDDFYRSILLGHQHFRALPSERWKGMDALHQTLSANGLPSLDQLRGAWIDAFDIDLLRFKIQPNEAERTTPQQILMLKVADRAIRDAGLDKLEGQGANVAVIIAMETDLEIHHRLGRYYMPLAVQQVVDESGLVVPETVVNALTETLKNAVFSDHEGHSISEHTGFIGNIIASRIAALMDFTGPAFTVSSAENGVYKGLEIARNLLASREVDAVVLGAVDLGGGLESILARHAVSPIHTGPVSMGWNHRTEGWTIGEGAGAIVLKRADDATNHRVYARLDDLAIVQSDIVSLRGAVSAKAVAEAARQVLDRQQLKPGDIGYLEIAASGIPAEDQAEITGLTQVYTRIGEQLSCALGSSKAHVGHTFAASGIAALIKTALSLYHHILPGVPNWEGPTSAAPFANSLFYVPDFSRPWMRTQTTAPLRAAVNGLAADGTCVHGLLSEGDHPAANQPSTYLLRGGERLFPIQAITFDALRQQLTVLEIQLTSCSLSQVSDQLCAGFATANDSAQRLVLVASSIADLRRDIRFFQSEFNRTEPLEAPLQTPSGSYYTPKPVGTAGKLALIYPGSGSLYVGAGSLLLQAFPGLYERLYQSGYDPAEALGDALYPRCLFALRPADKQEKERQLQTAASAMMLGGCTFSGLFTKALQEYLGVKAQSVAGFSMGEVSAMWYSQEIWPTTYVEEKFIQAPLFREAVGGPMRLLADVWQLPETDAPQRWTSQLIRLPNGLPGYFTLADWFRQEVASTDKRVYLTFINTDTEIIISGDREAVQQVLAQYQLPAVSVPINNVLHHEFCRLVSDELIEMHHLPTRPTADKLFYSSITGEPIRLDADVLAENALEVCCRPVDWPRIIRRLADDNHTVFIEVGANAVCSRWISEILASPDQVVLPMDRKGASVVRTITGLVARLLAHGVPVDLTPFYCPQSAPQLARRTLKKTLRTGGPRFESLVLTPENRQSFSQLPKHPKPMLVRTDPTLPTPYSLTSSVQPMTEPTEPMAYLATMTDRQPNRQVAENGLPVQDYTDPTRLRNTSVIWNEADLLTFASGRIQDVFGEEYARIDTFPRRVMLPKPPYLLVSRVTKLAATPHIYKPSTITTEYDIPYGSAFTTDEQIPIAVAVESGQCDLLLISYLGIDFQNKGEYVYRLLDCTLTFTDDLPFEGQTLRYDISIDRFVRSEQNLLFFFSYRCYVDDRLVLKMDGGCAGFFSDADLALGQGVVFSPQERNQQASRLRKTFTPLLECAITAFSKEDLQALVRGDLVRCFGPDYFQQGRNPSLRLPPNDILMLDRIVQVNRKGGSSGLGFIEAEKDLHPDDWYFPCHFRDDEVLAGSLQAEGGSQLLRFYMLLLGMQRLTKDARFQPILDKPQKVRCRKEVPARAGKLVYQLDIREIGLLPEPYVVADLTILYEGQIAVFFESLGLRLQEKTQPAFLKNSLHRQEGIYIKPVDKPVLFNEYQITQFALGSIAKCFGDEYASFDERPLSRQPNTDLQLISRVLSTTGRPGVFANKPMLVSEYDVPSDAWYFTQNASPVMPYSILMEIALQPCGFLGAYLGSTLPFSEKDLFFRNLDGEGELTGSIDLRGKTITNHATLDSHIALNGTILQRYRYALTVDGTLFYQGTAAFGFFSKDDLSSQVGLDQGTHVPPWYMTQNQHELKSLTIKLDSLFGRLKLFQSTNPLSPHLHLAWDQLNLLDTAIIMKEGGRFGKGYVFARKAIAPFNWFFTCHFYQDPVMPGSLGVEAMLQAVHLFALQQGLADGLTEVTFQQLDAHKTTWKYRGQILSMDADMNLEIHIKTIDRTDTSVRITADANLWKGPLRIYTVTNLGVLIR